MYVPAPGPGNGWVFPLGSLEQLQGSAKLCLLSWAVRKLLPRQCFLYNISSFQIFMNMSDIHVLLTRDMLCGFSQHSRHADKRQIQQDFLQKVNENIQDFSLQRIVWKSLGQVCKCVCLTLDLTVISLISAGLRLNYFGLTSVHLRAELGLLKVWMFFLSSWGIFWQWLCRSCPHAVTCLHNKPPLYHLASDISDTFSYGKAFPHPIFPP